MKELNIIDLIPIELSKRNIKKDWKETLINYLSKLKGDL